MKVICSSKCMDKIVKGMLTWLKVVWAWKYGMLIPFFFVSCWVLHKKRCKRISPIDFGKLVEVEECFWNIMQFLLLVKLKGRLFKRTVRQTVVLTVQNFRLLRNKMNALLEIQMFRQMSKTRKPQQDVRC